MMSYESVHLYEFHCTVDSSEINLAPNMANIIKFLIIYKAQIELHLNLNEKTNTIIVLSRMRRFFRDQKVSVN